MYLKTRFFASLYLNNGQALSSCGNRLPFVQWLQWKTWEIWVVFKALNEIEPGMIVTQDVVAGDITLIKKGATIRDLHIKAFNKWGVARINVILPGMDPHDDPEFQAEYQRLTKLFETVDSDDEQMALLRECMFDLLEAEIHGE
jgi:hypothetical protein